MKTPQTFLKKSVLFILIPAFILNLFFKNTHRVHWYAELPKKLNSSVRNYFVLGSSRVAAAIDSGEAERVLFQNHSKKTQVYNLGLGYTSVVQHVLGLRRLAEQAKTDSYLKQSLEGSYWLYEAPGGYPVTEKWAGMWYQPEYLNHLLDVMGTNDLPELWKNSAMNWDQKIYITVAHFSDLGRALLDLRTRWIVVGERFFSRYYSSKKDDPDNTGSPNKSIDQPMIAEEGGIRTDQKTLQFIRDQTKRLAEQNRIRLNNQTRFYDWKSLALYDWVKAVQSIGGIPIIFQLPLSSYGNIEFETPIRKADIKDFRREIKKWGAYYLEVPFKTQDQDFPDLVHLGVTRRKVYTNILFHQFKAQM